MTLSNDPKTMGFTRRVTSKFADLHFYQAMSWHSPRLEGKAVCFFANAVAHQRDGRCRAVTGRPSCLGRERERLCGPSAARFVSAKLDAYDAVETRISFYKLRYNIYTHAYIYIRIIWLMIYQVASLVLNAGFILVIFARSKFMELLISQISGEC